MKIFFSLLLLLVALPAQAQNVRLQLFDHVVGTEILHNQPLPAGTEVWVVTKPEARAMRLRTGYGEVVEGLIAAMRDRVGQNGYTEKSYPVTQSAGRAYFVVARLPDGRLFQSYVRTGDSGMQPGFDAVQSGRISMGQTSDNVRERLEPALTGTPPAPPATTNPPGVNEVPADSTEAPDLAGDLVLPDFPDSSLLASDSAFAPSRAMPMQEVEEDDPMAEGQTGSGRAWLWFLLGLAAGGAAAYFGAAAYYERLLRRQRENLLRYVPLPPESAADDAAEPEA